MIFLITTPNKTMHALVVFCHVLLGLEVVLLPFIGIKSHDGIREWSCLKTQSYENR